jgi:hypothetical protein
MESGAELERLQAYVPELITLVGARSPTSRKR